MPEKPRILENPNNIEGSDLESGAEKEQQTLEVRFSPQSLSGKKIEYVSSAAGRKIVVLNEKSKIVPRPEAKYRVQLIKDTEPDNPQEGKLIVKILEEISPMRHREAQFHRAEQLRQSTAIQVALKIMRRNPDVYREMQQVLKRQQEFKNKTALQDERHRDFAGLFSAMHLNTRASGILNEAIDRSVRAETEWMKERIREGENFVHELVIGTGVQSAAYRVERLIYYPDDPGAAMDSNPTIGGQFSQSGDDVHFLNSRTRPENIELENLPGTEGSINSIGRYAPFQLADSSGVAYSSNWDLAENVRANQAVIGRNMVNMEFLKIQRNDKKKNKVGEVKAICRDTVTGETFEMYANRIILSTGTGTEKSGLDENDPTTRFTVEEAEKQWRSGLDSKFYKFSWLMQRLGDKTEPFPIQGWKEVVTWGDGDGFKVAAGSILGYEGQVAKTVAQLDRIQKVIAIGQEFLTKEKFIECERVRYHQLGLEFPREEVENYYYRIQPYKGKVRRIRKENGRLIVEAEIQGEDNSITLMEFSGDHALACAGSEDETDKLVADNYRQVIDNRDEFKTFPIYFKLIGTPGSLIETNSSRLEVLRSDSDTVTYRIYRISLTPKRAERLNIPSRTESREDFERLYTDIIRDIQRVIIGTVPKPELIYDDDPDNPDPIAVQYPGLPVQKIGPSANLPITANEIAKAPVLEKIKENSVAIFRYSQKKVAALARKNAKEDLAKGIKPRGLSLIKPEQKPVRLPEIGRGSLSQFEVYVPREVARRGIPEGAVMQDLLNLVVGEKALKYRFPENLDAITFHVSREKLATDDLSILVSTDQGLPVSYAQLVDDIFQDELMQRMVAQMTDPNVSMNSSGKLDIILPIELTPDGDRVIDIGNVTYKMPRRAARLAAEAARA